ncbi:FAD/NAD(P)-binding protein [Streptococcus iniae]|uniref:FAD-dependent urate hydroxylase HpyO/Asp monooxygenase CreE-like FAD/NAD(P)-binding domain-containing protein n=1 Tax=Streptococcus iniae TaxID=1346 RepID=A0ABM5QGC6_STRIN|nr:FAD/NAD(P)-binding protein [Streptococcus iniae]AHY15133.1 hypothetical protein DQ08_01235 [Streptococcus iniae]AHY17003.1 hypothetical protein DW64_01230 [Streptococcus iniae]WKZ89275.1 FAD/NAD(P)-binding protein [Streptococcus iniae]
MTKKIAIVGMGVSGLAVLLAFSRVKSDDLANIELYCFDDAKHFGRGIPFQSDHKSALINSPINDISFDYRDMEDFIKWLAENGYDTEKNYVSRSLYGKYLSERADDFIHKLPVRTIKESINDLHYLSKTKQWQLTIKNEVFPTLFDELHLACGQLSTSDPYQLDGNANYISDPYPIQKLAQMNWNSKRIAVIGTGLAAVDVLKWLITNTKTSLIAFSRSNAFPSSRVIDNQPIPWQFFTQEKLQTLLHRETKHFSMEEFEELFLGELQNLGFKDWESTKNQFLATGTQGIALASQFPRQLFFLQQLASRVTDWFTDLWPLMTPSDQKEYQKIYGKAIINLRNPMPEESAQIILEASKTKRLTIVEDVEEVNVTDSGFSLTVKDSSEQRVDMVINATGYNLTKENQTRATPLLQSLLNQQLCQIDPLGGLAIFPETVQVISPKYGIMPTLYAHGALVNGVIYQNNSTIKIQKLAERAVLRQ